MGTLVKYLYGIVGFFAGAFLAFFLCHELDLNPFNDEDDTHVLEFHSSTTYEVNKQTVEIPPAKKEVIAGQSLDDSEKKVFLKHRGLQSHSVPPNGESNTKDGNGASVSDIGSVNSKDDFFKILDSAFWSTSQLVTLADTSFVHSDSGYYYFSFLVDCFFQQVYDFKVWTSPITLVTINTKTVDVVVKRPWLRFGPYVGTNALNLSEWQAGVNVAIRYGDFWANAAVELPMANDPALNIPVSLEYDLITLER